MKQFLLLFALFISLSGFSQQNNNNRSGFAPTIEDALSKYGFLQEQLIHGKDTIVYYLRSYEKKPSKLVVFIQGTDPNPIFSYKIKEGKPVIYRWFNDDYKALDDGYAYAIIPKPGIEGIFNEDGFEVPQEYHRRNYREYRVNQLHYSIEHIKKHHLQGPEKIIVYGHSEGGPIAAALANKNKSITHLGFWSGNVLNNFYEFSLFNRIEALKGKQTDASAHANIMGIIEWYKSVIEDPNSTELDHFGFTNKRWSSYEQPPIEDLLKLEIPIYALFATKDESTPIETAYLLPVQFLQKRKKNLTFEVCMECDHSYTEQKNGEKIKHWKRIFKEFMEWTEK
ncbi:hypothetical protein GWK08_05440 [Leptobacterium flavescens]|uniref:Prolyl oligopeptidase family serine peptidase n=1 Tax=Leptobacterium flavescens TaxID=472055 RepID=A0A6P0UPN1_9FLAO|nr:alpha/beta hydrolase [Leptobacterium flavescens]NER12873.1 hypothetical protein [Leptobacterium flavescens]